VSDYTKELTAEQLIRFIATDYVELWWETDSTQVSIQTYAAAGNYPSTASLIATMSFVSNLPTL